MDGIGEAVGLRWEGGYRYLGRLGFAVLVGIQNHTGKDGAQYQNGEARNLVLEMNSLYVECEIGHTHNIFFVNGVFTLFFNRKLILESTYSGQLSESPLDGTYIGDTSVSTDVGIAIGIFKEPIIITGKIGYPIFTKGGSTVLQDKRIEKFENGTYLENSGIIFSKNGLKEKIIQIDDILLKGDHNIYNCMAAVDAAKIYNSINEKIAHSLKSFKGLEHRFEFVDSIEGVNFINDSKATNVDSVFYALKSIRNRVILLAGGRDKKGDLSALNSLIKEKVKTLILFGEAAERMQKEWTNLSPHIIPSDSFEDAFNKAWISAKKGDTILLSPACSSFDMFKNFEERGEKFKELVKRLKGDNE